MGATRLGPRAKARLPSRVTDQVPEGSIGVARRRKRRKAIQEQINVQAGLEPLLGDGLGLPPRTTTADLDQLMQDGIRDVLGGSQGSLLPIPSLPEGGALPIVDQHGHLQLAGLELPPLPGEPDVASQVRDTNCSAPRRAAPPSAPMSEDEVDQSDDDDDDDDGGGGGGGGGAANAADKDNETGSSGRPGRGVKRKKAGKGGKRNATPGMQGRFSGRLGTKEDEKRLAAECRLIGPLLGGAARGEKSLHTLAKLVRAIAAGQVRAHLEAQEAEIQDLRAKLLLLSDGDGQQLMRLQDDNTQLRRELAASQRQAADLEQKLAAANGRLQAFSQSTGRAGQTVEQTVGHVGSMPVMPPSAPATLAFAGAPGGGMTMPVATASVPASLPVPAMSSLPAATAPAQPQVMLASAPVAALTAAQLAPTTAPGLGAPLPPPGLALPDAAAAAVVAQQQAQALAAVPQAPAPIVVSMAGGGAGAPAVQPLLMAQPAVPTLSGGALAASKPALTGVSDALSGEAAAAQPTLQPALLPAATQPALSGPDSGPAAAAADQAAQNLNQQAQHLTVQATLHEQARTHATSQAQQLASQAQLHAQASVQAAVQAEQLKQTLATAVLPDTQQAQQAVATVQNLEERAKAHADITTQAVAQARELQEKAQAHAAEQAKAMAQANMLQAHAQSLAASAQHLEASAAAASGPASTPGGGEHMVAGGGGQASGALPALVMPAGGGLAPPPSQPTASVSNRPEGAAPELSSIAPGGDPSASAAAPPAPTPPLHAVASQAQLQQGVLQAPPIATSAGGGPSALLPGQLPNGHGLVPPMVSAPSASMAAAGSGSMAGGASGSLAPPLMASSTLPQAVLQPSMAPSGGVSLPPSTAAQQASAPLQEQLAALQQAQAQAQAQAQQAAALQQQAQQEQLMMAQHAQQAGGGGVEQQAAAHAHAAAAHAQQTAAVAQHQLQQAVAAQAHLQQQATAAAAAAAAAQDQVHLGAAVAEEAAQQHAAAAQQAAPPQLVVQVDVVQGGAQPQLLQQAGMVPSSGATPVPAAASAILQPTPHSLQQSHMDVKVDGVAAPSPMPAASGSAALMDGRGGGRPGPEVSTGLTPQVGALELPPGIEAIVPSNQPLTADPAALHAAAAMGPVVALPPQGPSGAPSLVSLPRAASEGQPAVASASSV